MYLLDTDTIIYSLKGNSEIKKNLLKHINDPLHVSVISMMELYYGAYKSEKRTSNLAKVKVLEKTLNIIPVGSETVEIFGMVKAHLETDGLPLDDFDLIIGACALSRNLVLVTNNTRHFQRIEGLKLENWTAFS